MKNSGLPRGNILNNSQYNKIKFFLFKIWLGGAQRNESVWRVFWAGGRSVMNVMLCDLPRLGHRMWYSFYEACSLSLSLSKYLIWDPELPCRKSKAVMLWGSTSQSTWCDPTEKPWDHLKKKILARPQLLWRPTSHSSSNESWLTIASWQTLSKNHLAELSPSSSLTETMRNNKCSHFKPLFWDVFFPVAKNNWTNSLANNNQVWLILVHPSQALNGSLVLENIGIFLAGIQTQLPSIHLRTVHLEVYQTPSSCSCS